MQYIREHPLMYNSARVYEHIFGSPSGVQDFPRARNSEMVITVTPKDAQRMAGSLVRLYHGIFLSASLR